MKYEIRNQTSKTMLEELGDYIVKMQIKKL
jgi:hypothetical protein